jgi:uncharacterized protein
MQMWSLDEDAIRALTALPETGMGFQFVEGSLMGRIAPLLVFNSERAVDVSSIGLEPGDDPTTILRNGLKIVELLKSEIVQTYWILFCSASGMTIHMTEVQEQLRALRSFGYGVLSFDYRGFGGNAGEPTEEGVYTDAESAYTYLTKNLLVHPTRVILAGRSLGSAVAVELATRVTVAGLVLFSPIDSVPLTGARLYPWFPVRHFARNQFDNLAKVGRLQSPVVVVYGTRDEMIPIDVARSLFERVLPLS